MAGNQINLLQALINAAEKASNIARVCRSNEELLGLLVQEKTGTEANARFEHDFKTLADVLIQETIKHDVGCLFPSLLSNIRGEESPNFTNALGESVTIAVGETTQQTTKCLAAVLHKHPGAAEALAEEVHRHVNFNDETHVGQIPELPGDMNYANLGIWIDPIDATAQYIAGETIFSNFPGITSSGLDCVTVLIGVYELSTGIPLIGVIAQPFKNQIKLDSYTSNIYWGVSLAKLQANNCTYLDSPSAEDQVRNLRCIFSTSEQADILHLMQTLGYEFVFSAGAGHKALKVITGEADTYILSQGSTFFWDTCAPQAILRSMGGDIFDLKKSLAADKAIMLNYALDKNSVDEHKDWKCNEGGLLAVRHVRLADEVLEKIKTSE